MSDGRVGWTPRLLVICVILWVFSTANTVKGRFKDARLQTLKLHGNSHRKRPGKTCEGFTAALCKSSATLLDLICMTLRQIMREIAGEHWTVEGWALFGVDGTKVECPQTLANEEAFGCAGRPKSTPQQLLTVLMHLGTGLPWGFIRGPGPDSEREQLQRMLGLMPAGSMLAADAGFTGYDLLRTIMAQGHQFVIRVGRSVRLLKKLGYAVQEHDGIVYLWPYEKQGRRNGKMPANASKAQEPLVLRLIELHNGRTPVYLLSSVLDRRTLSDKAAAKVYRRRWGLELFYRSLKQTMEHRKLLSDGPRQAEVELDWCVVGLWMLGVMSVEALVKSHRDPADASVAAGLAIVREALSDLQARWRYQGLRQALSMAVKDGYRRRGRKAARHPKTRKKERPPGRPTLLQATGAERALARRVAAIKAQAHGRARKQIHLEAVLPTNPANTGRKHFAA